MKVSVIILPFRKNYLIKPVFDAIFAQTYKDLEVIAVLNDSSDGSKDIIQKDYSQVKIVEPGYNSLFAIGNNIGIKNSSGEFIQLVNDDLLLEPNYVEDLLMAFTDQRVASATGKILRYDFKENKKLNIIDTTGLILWTKWMTGRVRDRGQLQEDRGQFDHDLDIFGVSGAAPMYRRSALEKVKFDQEFFDEDFKMYWEDVDLSWRFNNAGFKSKYVPQALAYHGRTAGSSKGGYIFFWRFIAHHRKIPSWVRKLNYKNHFLMYIKNAKNLWHPAFWLREMGMLGYIIVFEPGTLKIIPELVRLIPRMWKKRKASVTH